MAEQDTNAVTAGIVSTAELATLKIIDVQTLTFRYLSYVGRDDEGHGHPAPEHEARRTLTRVRTSIGVDGYCFGGSAETAAVATRMVGGMNP
ncbi:MAG TPA: hypothetical protein VGR16_01520, partial [Thermomicrobiales bacterium]|nr:hypothetical protein [Thermomicrobiales bacterium]